ncbi:isochorismatase family protein [Streptomyces sp. NPDC002667]|uniref:isochorismatase family protein n=1 Tax=Streptomyces sp. NPDC002667 TaxID=3364657 RepID=UPI0036B25586
MALPHPPIAVPGPLACPRCGPSRDSFLDTGLGDLLDEQEVCRVIITGFATEYCVDSTSRSAPASACESVPTARPSTSHRTHDPADPNETT